MHLSRVVIPLAVAAASVVGVQDTASSAALAAPGGTGHTVTMTEVTHGDFDAGLTGPNPCSGADIVSADASGTVLDHITYFPMGTRSGGRSPRPPRSPS